MGLAQCLTAQMQMTQANTGPVSGQWRNWGLDVYKRQQYDTPITDKAFFAQSAVVRELAARNSCVIVGRCADYLLREDVYKRQW